LTRGSTPSRFKAPLYSPALWRALLDVSRSPAALSPTPAELHLRPFAVNVGEAEGHSRSPLSRTTR
jgi:hypothetical protein